MKAFKLWLLAIFLLTVVNVVNRVVYKRRIAYLPKADRRKKMEEYDRQEAMALDAFAGRNYRVFWNQYLILKNGYQFGVEGEMISSALGKNEVMETLSEKGSGRLSKWFYGKMLVKYLNKIDPNHCLNAININHGDWTDPRQKTKL